MPRKGRYLFTEDQLVEQYAEVARRVGHTPTHEDVGWRLRSAIYRIGMTLSEVAERCGLVPNQAGLRVHPLPDGWDGVPTQAKPKPEPVDIKAVYGVDLAAEREAHCRRMAEKWKREPWTMPGYRGYTPRPRGMRQDFGSRERHLLRGHDDYLPPTDLVAWFQKHPGGMAA